MSLWLELKIKVPLKPLENTQATESLEDAPRIRAHSRTTSTEIFPRFESGTEPPRVSVRKPSILEAIPTGTYRKLTRVIAVLYCTFRDLIHVFECIALRWWLPTTWPVLYTNSGSRFTLTNCFLHEYYSNSASGIRTDYSKGLME